MHTTHVFTSDKLPNSELQKSVQLVQEHITTHSWEPLLRKQLTNECAILCAAVEGMGLKLLKKSQGSSSIQNRGNNAELIAPRQSNLR